MDQNYLIRLAYLAGYFDGEGCITVLSHGKLWMQIRIAIVSTDLGTLSLFSETLGGDISVEKRQKGKKLWAWRMNGKDAIRVLRLLAPHMVAKRNQAEAVIGCEWQGTQGKRTTPEQFESRLALKIQLRKLKDSAPLPVDEVQFCQI